jgi:hypothetical protein
MSVVDKVSKLAGHLIRPLRAGDNKLAGASEAKHEGFAGLRVATSSFVEGHPIPDRHAGEHGVAPELHWSGVPAEAKEVVVLCEDPDAPMPKPFVHWAVYGLSPDSRSLPEGLTPETTPGAGAHQGKNSTGKAGFMGPKPPPGHGVHHYHFQVFALDARLGLGDGVDRDALVAAMQGRVIASGEVIGTYER